MIIEQKPIKFNARLWGLNRVNMQSSTLNLLSRHQASKITNGSNKMSANTPGNDIYIRNLMFISNSYYLLRQLKPIAAIFYYN